MIVYFDKLADTSKIWIYQADRFIHVDEEKALTESLTAFCNQWTAHGQVLRTSFKIEHHYFIILGVDESYSNASGCSIDGSVHMLKAFQQQWNLDFFDRRIAFFVNNEVKTYPMPDVKAFFKNRELDETSMFFNNSITSKSELSSNWLIPVKGSWLARHLPDTVVVS